MNYLIVGGKGFLGSYFIEELKKKKHNIISADKDVSGLLGDDLLTWISCDITDVSQVGSLLYQMEEKAPYNVIYLAAFHNPDEVERNPKVAWDINITALSYFLNKAKGVEKFFYASTDTVYGEGRKEYAFKEEDIIVPVNRYGKHKALAENMVTTYGYNVVRFPFLIGPSLSPHKKHFYDIIYETLLNKKNLEMFYDSYRSTLSFRQAATFVLELAELSSNKIPLILNIASDEVLSKYDIALMIAEKNGLDKKYIIPISIHDMSDIFEVPRAPITIIDNTKLKKIMGIPSVFLSFD